MAPLFFTLGNRKSLMVIPDTHAHLDGHVVLTYTYSIYRDSSTNHVQQAKDKESTIHLDHVNDPDYYGYITFEKPGDLFSYTTNGTMELNADEVQEVIENVSHIRDNPSLWKHPDM